LLYIARSNEYIPDPENEDKLSLSAGDIVEPGDQETDGTSSS